MSSTTRELQEASARPGGPVALGVSVIIPARERAESVAPVVREVVAALEASGRPFEVIVVDDASTDGTGDLARGAGARVITHPHRRGYGASLKDGARAARHPLVLFYDADGRFDPNDIDALLAYLPEFDMSTGWRDARSHARRDGIVGENLLNPVANWLARQRIPDLDCGFRAIKREVLRRYLHLIPDGVGAHATITLLFLRQGHPVRFVPKAVEPTMRKGSGRPVEHNWQTALLIVRLVTLLDPLRAFLPLSAAAAVAGALWALPFLMAGRGLTVGASFLLLAAMILFFFGLVVEHLAAIRRDLGTSQGETQSDDALDLDR